MGSPSDPLGFARDLRGIPRDLTRDPLLFIYQQFEGIPRDLGGIPEFNIYNSFPLRLSLPELFNICNSVFLYILDLSELFNTICNSVFLY